MNLSEEMCERAKNSRPLDLEADKELILLYVSMASDNGCLGCTIQGNELSDSDSGHVRIINWLRLHGFSVGQIWNEELRSPDFIIQWGPSEMRHPVIDWKLEIERQEIKERLESEKSK